MVAGGGDYVVKMFRFTLSLFVCSAVLGVVRGGLRHTVSALGALSCCCVESRLLACLFVVQKGRAGFVYP